MRRLLLAALVFAVLPACAAPTARSVSRSPVLAGGGPGRDPGPISSAAVARKPVATPVPSATTRPTGAKAPAASISLGQLLGALFAPTGFHSARKPVSAYALAALAEQPLADVDVYLTTRTGQKIAGVAVAKTDAAGKFALANVPEALAFVVAADVLDAAGKPVQLRALARRDAALSKLGSLQLSYASSVVTAAALKQSAGDVLGPFDVAAYEKAVAAASLQLDPANLPRLDDQAAIDAAVAAMVVDGAALTASLSTIRDALSAHSVSAEDAQKLIDQAAGTLTGTPVTVDLGAWFGVPASPSPEPSASPSAAPSEAPSAAPGGG